MNKRKLLTLMGGSKHPQLDNYSFHSLIAGGINLDTEGVEYLYGKKLTTSATVVRKLLTGQVIEERGAVTAVNANYIVQTVYTTTTPDLIFVVVAYTLFAGKHYLLRSTDGGATFTQVMIFGEGNGAAGVDSSSVSILTQASFLETTVAYPGGGGVGDLYIVEYNSNAIDGVNRVEGGQNDMVRIMKSTDDGANWTAAMTWNTDGHQVSHAHGIKQDPYTGYIYVLLGDTDAENGIIRWDGATAWTDNTLVSAYATIDGFKSYSGSQRGRCVDLMFTQNYVISGSDSTKSNNPAGDETGIWRWTKDLSSSVRVNNDVWSYDGMHVMWAAAKLGNTLIWRTARMAGPGAPGAENWSEAHTQIYLSDDEGGSWYKAGLEMHEADLTNAVSTYANYTFVYDNKLYIDSVYGLYFKGTASIYILGRSFNKGQTPIVVHPVYYVGFWNNAGVDSSDRGKNPDRPLATRAYLTGTIGSTEGRVKEHEQVDITGAWLSGGILPATLIGAYQSRGAASYAASLVNLANPGLHDLVSGATAPGWSTETGWDASNSGYLITDITPTETTFVLCIYSGITSAGGKYAFGVIASGYFMFAPLYSTGNIRPWWGDYGTSIPLDNTAANVAGLGTNMYWFNQTKGVLAATWTNMTNTLVLLGTRSGGNPTAFVAQGLWPAFYIYSSMPTDAQILAVDNALRALFP